MRFEDTYGMADVFSAVMGIPYFSIAEIKKLIKVNDDIFMIFGLSNTDCLSVKRGELNIIDQYKPENIITIMDLDKENNDGTGILSYDTVKINLRESERKMKMMSPNSKISYIPTVYASETIMLYQYLMRTENDFCIEEIVHPKNTWIFHAVIIAIMANLEKLSDVKKVRNYLTIDRLLNAFQDTLDDFRTENIELMNFMLDREYNGNDLDSFLRRIEELDSLFKKCMCIPVSFNVCGVSVNSNDNLFAKKTLFSNFPKSFR